MSEKEILEKIESDSRNGEIHWEVDDRRNFYGTNERLIGNLYVTSFVDDYLRIYEFEYSVVDAEGDEHWFDSMRLEIVSPEGLVKWQFGGNRKIRDIYEIAKYQAEGISSIFQRYLGN